MNNYDLAIVYRIYPKISKVPPIYSNDKYKLAELCLKSFARSVKHINAKVWVLFDNCPQEYSDMFKLHLDGIDSEFINLNGIGNAQTFKKQMDILLNQNASENIYFAEDDYFYLEDAFEKMLSLMNSAKADFISPYDHDDVYKLNIHDYNSEIILEAGHHWRSSGSTTMTFMTNKKILRQSEKIFRTYIKNNYDASLWLTITGNSLKNPLKFIDFAINDKVMRNIYLKAWYFSAFDIIFGKKYKLFTPMPSLANHMDDQHLAPNIDWHKEFNKLA